MSRRRVATYLLAFLSFVATTAHAAAPPSPAELRRAQQHIDAADEHFEKGDWDRAVARYQAALAIVPETPALVWNIARALEEKGETKLAVAYFERMLRLEDLPDDVRERVQTRIDALAPPSPEAPVAIPEPTPVEPEPTPAIPTVRAEEDPLAATRGWGWASVGVGVAAIGAGAALAVVSQGSYDEVRDAPVRDGITQVSRSGATSAQARGDREAIGSIAALACGGAALATGIVLLIRGYDDAPTPVVGFGVTPEGWSVSSTVRF